MTPPARLAVFASGRGSNLASLLAAFPPGAGQEVALVVSNVPDAPALDRAREAGLPAEFLPWPKGGRAAFEARANGLLAAHSISHVLLAGFMRLLSADFTERWRGRILNIHPSLLPDFPGLHAQAQALAAGVPFAGCTVHFVDAGMDTGETVLQKRVPILPGDSEDSLAARLLPAEHEAYPQAVRLLLAGLAFPSPPASQVFDEFGLEVAASPRRVRAARLLRAWGQEAEVPFVLSGVEEPLSKLALATDDLRLAWTGLEPLEERRARWANRGALLAQAAPFGLEAQVEAALSITAAEWESTRF